MAREIKNISSLFVLQIANYLIPLITLPFMVRTLGIEAYGWLVFAASVNFFFVLAVDAGMNTYAARELARLDPLHHPENTHEAAQLVFNTSAFKLCLALVAVGCLFLLIQIIPSWKNQWLLLMVSFLPVLGSLTFPTWFFQGIQAMHHTTQFAIGGRLLVTIALFIWVRSPDDVVLAATLQGAATLVSGLLAMPTWVRLGQLQHASWDWQRIKAIAYASRSLMGSEYAVTALANSTVFMVGLSQSKEVVGLYAAIEKAIRAAASLFNPVIQGLAPRMVQAWSAQGFSNTPHPPTPTPPPPAVVRQWSGYLAMGLVIASIMGVLLAPWLLPFVLGSAVTQHSHWGQWLCVWLPFGVGQFAFAQWWWVASGRTQRYGWIMLWGTSLQAMAFAGINWGWGVSAGLIGLAGFEALMLLWLVWVWRRS